VAARVHALPPAAFPHVPASVDSLAHVHEELAEVSALAFTGWPIAVTARDWIVAHAERRPAVVLHGDLLPQNIVWDFHENGRVGVIDWECARIGDAAYDLAIVTRGARQPQKEMGGRERLLARYNEMAAAPLTLRAVQIHEVLLHLRWLGQAAEEEAAGKREGHGPLQYAQTLAAMLRRFEASRG
jgi:aminoglycoside phosphotransferase (APT) family kinase protein